jgi:hypothetical protein
MFDDVNFLRLDEVKMLLLPFHTWGQFTSHFADTLLCLLNRITKTLIKISRLDMAWVRI